MKIIDLTHSINNEILTFERPWHPKVDLQQLGFISHVGRNTHKVVLGSHTGTHIDAPLHFIKDGNSIDKLDLEILTGEARVVDFRDLAPLTKISTAMLEERLDGTWPKRLLLCFGWDKYWGTPQFYQGFPSISEELAENLVNNGVKLVGMDSCMPDSPISEDGVDSPIHKILLESNVIIVEYLCNLYKLPKLCKFVALPLKLEGLDGSPARCIAILN